MIYYIACIPSHSVLDRRPLAHVLIAPSTCPLLPILKRQRPGSIFAIKTTKSFFTKKKDTMEVAPSACPLLPILKSQGLSSISMI